MKNTSGPARSLRMRTLRFTELEYRRIEKASKICGWKIGESARFARRALLRNVAAVLREKKARLAVHR